MQLIKTNENGYTSLDLAAYQLSETRTIYITGPIIEGKLNEVKMQMDYLLYESNKPINIVLNSPGGSVSEGLGIYDLITSSNCEVSITVIGEASSIAAIILAAGTKGKRFIYEHSTVLIHEPSIISNQNYVGNASSIKETAESLIELKRTLYEILENNTNYTVNQIEKLVNGKDVLLNAKEAVEFGICDVIVGDKNE